MIGKIPITDGKKPSIEVQRLRFMGISTQRTTSSVVKPKDIIDKNSQEVNILTILTSS